MDNNQNKFSNVDDYDLILEEKEKELKKEKRNKVILGSSLALLLLLGSTAVVAPIISVAVNNKNNSANINNIKIPSTLTFTDADITKLINSYKSEIQNKKLSFDEFQTNFINITKQYIFAGNTPIGTIVKSATITQNSTTDDYIINIDLDENKQYLSEQLTLATLNNNELSITLKYSEKVLGDFFTPVDISDKLNQLPELIENWIKDNQFTKEEFENLINDGTLKSEIVNLLKPNVNSNQIGNIKYEEPNLIIEPKQPDKFAPSDSSWIVDGNIVIPISKFYTTIKFVNLNKLFDKLNNDIKNGKYEVKQFESYLQQNLYSFKEFIANNLETENNTKITVDDILSISIENRKLVIKFVNKEYIKYAIQSNNNFSLKSNALQISNIDFFIKESPESWFTWTKWQNHTLISGLTEEGKKQTHLVIPSRVSGFNSYAFRDCTNLVSIDMSLMTSFWGRVGSLNVSVEVDRWNVNAIADGVFYNCTNLEELIWPERCYHTYWPEKIGEYAFYNCKKLKYVYKRTTPVADIDNDFNPSDGSTSTKTGIGFIGKSAFENSGLEFINITNPYKSNYSWVGENAFKNCTSLEFVWTQFPLSRFGDNKSVSPFIGCNTKIYIKNEEQYEKQIKESWYCNKPNGVSKLEIRSESPYPDIF